MAILNEWAIMGPNKYMLVLGIIAIVSMVLFTYLLFTHDDVNTAIYICSLVIISLLFVLGIFGISEYDEPNFEIPTGKKYIEATFANGSPTAAILQKYDVVDVDEDGKVYLLKEKDGVKDEKRPKVRIGNE